MIHVVYFNQWFSSITDVIADLKEKHKDEIKIIASSRNKDHAYKDVVNKFIVEDWKETSNKEESMNNYIDWVLDLCNKYKVDYFFVKKHMEEVAKHKIDFALNGTFLVCDNYDTLLKLSKKSEVYDILKENEVLRPYIPEYYCGNDRDTILSLVDEASKCGETPYCFKLDTDEGGASFRKIEQKPVDFESLKQFRVNSISRTETIEMLGGIKTDDLNKLLFMEVLDSPEVSVDCYKSKNGFIAICREKVANSRVQKIYANEEISRICEEIGRTFHFLFPYNVQFRIVHGKDKDDISNWRLLEINPRMSGGTYYTTLFDKNIADACLCDMMNMTDSYDIEKYKHFDTLRVTHVEKAIKL